MNLQSLPTINSYELKEWHMYQGIKFDKEDFCIYINTERPEIIRRVVLTSSGNYIPRIENNNTLYTRHPFKPKVDLGPVSNLSKKMILRCMRVHKDCNDAWWDSILISPTKKEEKEQPKKLHQLRQIRSKLLGNQLNKWFEKAEKKFSKQFE